MTLHPESFSLIQGRFRGPHSVRSSEAMANHLFCTFRCRTKRWVMGAAAKGVTAPVMGSIESMPDKEDRIINRRVRTQHTAMLQVVAGVKRTVESAP